MFYNYVYSQQPSYLIEFECNFHFMPIYTLNLWHSNSYGFSICKVSDFSPHVIFAVEWHRICDFWYVTFQAGWFGLSRFGLGTFRSDYGILKKFYIPTF